MKILIPNTIELPHLEAPHPVTFHRYDPALPLQESVKDAVGLVLWASSLSEMSELARQLPNLQWVQSLSAGIEDILLAGFPEGTQICSGAGLHNIPVAEHTLALILAIVRRLDHSILAQQHKHWNAPPRGNQALVSNDVVTGLYGRDIQIWGFGGIGIQLAHYLKALGANITGVARSSGIREGYRVEDQQSALAGLAFADIVVSTLPISNSTSKIFDYGFFRQLRPQSWFVNVGRGATVDESALILALESNQIAGAALDVFHEEPLPTSSPLWDMPNLILTPHLAGGRPLQAEALILDNLQRLIAGEPLRNKK